MKKILFLIVCVCALIGCNEYRVSDDPSLRLEFSTDTLLLDTVFTEQGSSTASIIVYNRNSYALMIDRVWLEDGEAFRVNIDGEADLSRLTQFTINGGDSAFVFVRLSGSFGEMEQNDAVLIEDKLHFHLKTGTTQDVLLQAYGQDVIRIGKVGCGRTIKDSYTFTADKPYIVFDTLVIDGQLTMNPGARVFMHADACIYAQGDVEAKGTLEKPISIRGDRLDRLFDSVPYLYAAGGWNGIYFVSDKPQTYNLQYVNIVSGNVGLYCSSTCTDALPQLTMNGCRIHNHTLYGLVLQHVDATISNTEISNCAIYCVYLEGGKHEFIHSTIASYFGYTNIRIQSASKEETSAVYIDNLSKTAPQTKTSFYNCIITGYLTNQLVVATPFDKFYPGVFEGNYLKTDTLAIPHAQSNVYWQKSDTANVFVKDFYKYKEYIYYDFHLDSISPAIGIGDSLSALAYPLDKDGITRTGVKPDAGCYQHN